MPAQGYVALVLHGHLPYAADGEAADRMGHRWLLEALWESYLPLLAVIERLAGDDLTAPLTLSVSPPLATMLRAPTLRRRLDGHLEELAALNSRERRKLGAHSPLVAAVESYAERLRGVREQWARLDGDVLGALAPHRRTGRIELCTTSASHAYLPGLTTLPQAVGAQLRLGQISFAKLSGHQAVGLWLPECAFDERFAPTLARVGYGYTILDAHGLEYGRPRPLTGAWRPVLDPSGLAYFGRDQSAAHQVWSRAVGYPGDPAYRDFYRDLGYERPAAELGGLGAGRMTGLKYYRITGRNVAKLPYDPAAAQRRVEAHADHFVTSCRARLSKAPPAGSPPILVAAYDAELFGHWWFEGPAFIEGVLRRLARSADLKATTLGAYLDAHPWCPVVRPASSSWGEGGYGRVWVGRRTAALWRHVHEAHRQVCAALSRERHAVGLQGAALDQAIRELLLLQSSDWAFMIHGRALASYGLERFRRHAARVRRLVTLASSSNPTHQDAAWLQRLRQPGGFLQVVSGEELREAFAP